MMKWNWRKFNRAWVERWGDYTTIILEAVTYIPRWIMKLLK
ncbi:MULTISPECIES: hypothetical protein [Paenibacillus]|nr:MULTISPECIES: hypothetical protein [Paenibacillus]